MQDFTNALPFIFTWSTYNDLTFLVFKNENWLQGEDLWTWRTVQAIQFPKLKIYLIGKIFGREAH